MRSFFATRRAMIGTAILCMVFLLIGVVIISWVSSGVEVIVTNNTSAEVKNLEIEFTGGITTTVTLKPDAVFRTTVKPTSESHLELRFVDALGKDHREIIGVYFEPGYKGDVLIELAPDGTVTFEDTIRLSGW